MIAEPLGPCAKLGCNKPAVLASPSGNPKSVYCKQHGHCGRANKDGLETCGTSVESFVKHPRLGIYVCPCVVAFDTFYDKHQKAMRKQGKP